MKLISVYFVLIIAFCVAPCAGADDDQITSVVEVELELPAEPVDHLLVAVPYEGRTYTFNLYKHRLRGENFRVRVQGEGGEWTNYEVEPGVTYAGQIEELPGWSATGSMTDRGLRLASSRPGWATMVVEPATQDKHSGGKVVHRVFVDRFASNQGGKNIDKPWNPQADSTGWEHARPDMGTASIAGLEPTYTATVKEFEIGFEITSNAFRDRYNYNIDRVIDNMDAMIQFFDEAWLGPALTKHVTGTILIRDDPESDPFAEFDRTSGSMLNRFRDVWNANANNENGGTHDVAGLQHGRGGGGLAWVGFIGEERRYGISGSGTRTGWRGFNHHEIGHVWGLGHGHGRTERLPNTNGTPFGIMWSRNDHLRPNTDEVARIIRERDEPNSGGVDIGPIPVSLPIPAVCAEG